MRIDIADTIKLGDIVYNCFMDKLVVTSIKKDYRDSHTIVFGTVDTRLYSSSYDSKDVYLEDLSEESDDEKSWIDWAKNNRDFFDEFDHIETMREVYKIAFCNGFEHKRKYSNQELLQK